MKKSILIGVLAALMLFAFTACENGTVTVDYIKQVYAVNNTETAYLPGETVSLSDYTFYAMMYDGRTVTVDASDIVFDSLVVPTGAKATDTISGSYKGSDFNVTLEYNLATVDTVTMDASAVATKQYIAAVAETSKDEFKDESLKLDGIEFTVKYTDENKVKGEKTFAATAVDSDAVTAALAIGTNTWTLSSDEVEAGSAARTVNVTYAGESAGSYTVTLVPNYISGLELKATDGYKVYNVPTNSNVTAKNNTLAYSADGKTAGIYLEATWDNGETSVVPTAQVSYVGENNAAITDVTKVDVTKSVTAKYNAPVSGVSELGIGVSDTAAALTVTVEADKIVDLTFGGIPTELSQGDYTDGVIAADFKVAPVFASGSTYKDDAFKFSKTGDGYVFTVPADLDLTEAETGRTEFTVSARVGALTFEKSFTTVITEA